MQRIPAPDHCAHARQTIPAPFIVPVVPSHARNICKNANKGLFFDRLNFQSFISFSKIARQIESSNNQETSPPSFNQLHLNSDSNHDVVPQNSNQSSGENIY